MAWIGLMMAVAWSGCGDGDTPIQTYELDLKARVTLQLPLPDGATRNATSCLTPSRV